MTEAQTTKFLPNTLADCEIALSKVKETVALAHRKYRELTATLEATKDLKSMPADDFRLLEALHTTNLYAETVQAIRADLTIAEQLTVVNTLQTETPERLKLEGVTIEQIEEALQKDESGIFNIASDVREYMTNYLKPVEQTPAPVETAPIADEVKVTTTNGVDTIALADVTTIDGVKPFADGKVVGVFDNQPQSIVERMGQPEDFITKTLQSAGVKHPTAWLIGMNPHYLKEGKPVHEKIYHINQQLRLRVAALVPETAHTISQRATIVDIDNLEDWYRITAANIVTFLAPMEKDLQDGYDKAKADRAELDLANGGIPGYYPGIEPDSAAPSSSDAG